MRLILVRHGRPNELDPETPGDPSLNADGWRQAHAVAKLLASEGVTRIVASPMLRARQTAEPLAERLGLAIETVDGWAEADRGAHRYRSTETLRAEGGEAWASFLADPIRYLGGEPEAFRAGVLGALDAAAAGEGRSARVVVFTHGLPINVVLAHALGLPTLTSFLVGYGSATRLRRRGDGGYGVASVNETGHHRNGRDMNAPAWDFRDVADLLEPAPLGDGMFRSRFNERNDHGRVFGGQMLGQSVMAAARAVPDDRAATYLQFLFTAGALPEQSIDYAVSPLQDGKRFASRHVRGAQAGGRIVCDASVSFARPMVSPRHAAPAPVDGGLDGDPERLPSLKDIAEPAAEVERTLGYGFREHPAIDLRVPFLEDMLRGDPQTPRVRFWIRVRAPMGDDPALHAAAFAYISDYWINFVACIPHVAPLAREGRALYVASLNHAIWWHAPFRADQWLLFDALSPRSALGRGLSIARIYARSGELVASATQECLLSPAG